MNNKDIDMLNGKLSSGLILFALPIALSSMLQQLFNAADTSVVGHFADSKALAAVGTNGEIVALLVTLSAGLAVGANVLIAKFIGEKKLNLICDAIHTSVLLAAILGIATCIIGQFISRPLLVIIKTSPEILDSAVVYLRLYFVGIPFLMIYDFGAAVLRAKGNSRFPFIILIISGIINVILNLVFVIAFKSGVAGVAAATDIATAFSAFMVIFSLSKEKGDFHFSLKKLRINKTYLSNILTIGIPSAVQGGVFCFANIFVQASVNSFGAIATAGSTIAMNFEYFGYYMLTAFGQAATTFTSQNFAAQKKDRCKKILTLCLLFSVIFSGIITIPLTIFKTWFSGLFSSDTAVIQAACQRIIIILTLEPICGLYEVPAGVLRGMGRSALPACITIIGTCLLRIVWIFTVFHKYHTLPVLFIIFPISWFVTMILMWAAFICSVNFLKKIQE